MSQLIRTTRDFEERMRYHVGMVLASLVPGGPEALLTPHLNRVYHDDWLAGSGIARRNSAFLSRTIGAMYNLVRHLRDWVRRTLFVPGRGPYLRAQRRFRLGQGIIRPTRRNDPEFLALLP